MVISPAVFHVFQGLPKLTLDLLNLSLPNQTRQPISDSSHFLKMLLLAIPLWVTSVLSFSLVSLFDFPEI